MAVTSSVSQRVPHESPVAAPSNAEVAELLERVSAFFLAQHASLDRARGWSVAASLIRDHAVEVRDVDRADGVDGLRRELGIAPRVAVAVDEIVRTRGLALLARFEGDLGPDPILAAPPPSRPPVALLLDVDAQYRARDAKGELPRVAPRRFNSARDAWLPVMHVEASGWHFSAMKSNTARAHRLGLVDDWVVIFAERDGVETQQVVLTERRGDGAGRRVVRARETETIEAPGAHP